MSALDRPVEFCCYCKERITRSDDGNYRDASRIMSAYCDSEDGRTGAMHWPTGIVDPRPRNRKPDGKLRLAR